MLALKDPHTHHPALMLQSTLTSPTNLQLDTDSALVALLICPQTPGPSTPLPFDTPAPAALSSPNSTPVLNEHLVALSDISQIYNIYFAPKSAGRSTPTTTPPPRKRKRVETPETLLTLSYRHLAVYFPPTPKHPQLNAFIYLRKLWSRFSGVSLVSEK